MSAFGMAGHDYSQSGQLIEPSKDPTLMSENSAFLLARPPLVTGYCIICAWPQHNLAVVKLPGESSQAFALREHPFIQRATDIRLSQCLHTLRRDFF
jgi:hypothetical protein